MSPVGEGEGGEGIGEECTGAGGTIVGGREKEEEGFRKTRREWMK